MNHLALVLVVILLGGAQNQTEKQWKRFNNREYLIDLHSSGNFSMATQFCNNMSAEIANFGVKDEWEFVKGEIPFLTTYGKLMGT